MGVTNYDIVQANGFIGPFLSGLSSLGVNTTGEVFYVCNSTTVVPGGIGGSNGNDGKSPQEPLADIDYAISRCTASRGDTIIVMPNHSETLASVITADIIGINIVGFGEGTLRPQITCNFVGDAITVTAANVSIYNLYFNEATAAATASINIAAANTKVQGCRFDVGANDVEAITVASGSNSKISGNEFITTANGPDAAIEIETAVANLQVIGNFFDGGSVTNAWDAGAINSGQTHTLCLVAWNQFSYGSGINFTAAATGFILNNFGGDPYDIGSCELHSISGGSMSVTQTTTAGGAGGGSGEPSIPPTTGNIFFVDSSTGAAGADASSPSTPEATVDAAVALCAHDKGDIILVLPNHAETLTAAVNCDMRGISIIGLGQGNVAPTLTINGAIDGVDITATDVTIDNLAFAASTAATTHMNITAANAEIRNCEFLCGAADADSVTIAADGDDAWIHDNVWRVTANGPSQAINIEAAGVANLKVENNIFDGGTVANSWDAAAIIGAAAHTNCLIKGNDFRFAAVEYAIEFSAAATGAIVGNQLGDAIIDPGSCYVGGNSGNEYSVSQLPYTTGRYIFVDNTTGSDALNLGYSPSTPMATVGVAIAKCTAGRGDVVVLMPDHNETLAAVITLGVVGMSLIGLKDGDGLPTITVNGVVDGITVTAADVLIKGIAFAASLAAATAQINIGAANVKVTECEFIQGVNDLEGITIEAAGIQTEITDNRWVVSADGPDRAINIEAAGAVGVRITDNTFIGEPTNGWDNAAIFSAANVVGIYTEGNVIFNPAANTHGIALGATSSGVHKDNSIFGNTSEYAVLVGSGIEINTIVTDTSSLSLQSGTPVTTGKYVFVNSATGAATNNGLSPKHAINTIDGGVAICAVNNYDTVIVLPGHIEAPTADILVNVDGIQIIGLGTGTIRPTITPDATGAPFSVMTVSVGNVRIAGLRFAPESSGNDITDQIHINTGLTDVAIENCEFSQAANDPLSLVYAGTSVRPTVSNNRWLVNADGPNNAITANGDVLSRGIFKDNFFDGGSAANSWDDGVILSNQINVDMLFENNKFMFGAANSPAIELTSATTGLIKDNFIAGFTEGYGIDAGACDTMGNKFANDARMDWKALPYTTSKYVFVDSNVINEGDGLSPDQAVNDLNAGIAIATTGISDVVICMPGHTETLTLALQIAVANDGIAIIGLGYGDNRPLFIPDNTAAYAGGMFTVTGDDVLIENVIFGTAVAAANGVQSQLEIAAGGDDIIIRNCRFDQGAFDLIGIDFANTADNVVIEGCEFVVSADGPTAAIANDNGVIVDCKYLNNSFNGGSLANAWDNGAIYSTQVNTGMIIDGNKLIFGAAANVHAINLAAAATGIISDSITDGLSMGYSIDPGSCSVSGNVSGMAVDSRAVPFPTYSPYVPGLGYRVSYTDGDVLDTVQNAIFTIAGGRVLITQLSMEITTAACAAGAATLHFLHDATAAVADYPLCTAANDIADAPVGSIFSISGVVTEAPTGGDPGSGAAMAMRQPIILSEGDIDIDTGADAGSGGALPLFEIWYIPLDAGAVLTPA